MLLTEFTTLLKNLWEKLMNNIKKYIKNIWAIMPMHTKKEKFYLNELKKHLNEYLDDHPQCSYDDIVQQFGEPKDIVVNYIQNSDENDLIKRMKLKSIIQKFLIFFFSNMYNFSNLDRNSLVRLYTRSKEFNYI